MNFEITANLSAIQFAMWRSLIESAGLVAEACASRTVLVFDGEELVATGGRDGCVLKLIAVANNHKGEDLTASVLSELRRDAFADGHSHLFLYTKPKNHHIFKSLFFYPVVETEDVLVMENKQGGIAAFLDTLPQPPQSTDVGAIVMNCNPFTFGHKSLIERAAAECDHVFVFILSEDKSEFSAADRFEMARLGTAHIPNVTVLPSGPYLISSATFPTYFLKDRDKAKQAFCDVDIEIFV
ncbi:MAG: adenylyltransferase/cytidyltransferase family protein, partial [Clostridia bacterium]|nr:adenylyltransferase/cytidyltransferase family protein [Clostridia bacterium]